MLLFPLAVLLVWSVILCWIMLMGMDLSPKGMLWRWCMWVYVWRIAIFAWSKRWEYQNKDDSEFFLGSALIHTPAEKRNNETSPSRETQLTGFNCDNTLDMKNLLIYDDLNNAFSFWTFVCGCILGLNCCTCLSLLQSLASSDLGERLDRQNKWLIGVLWGVLTSIAVANQVSCLDEESLSKIREDLCTRSQKC